MFIAVLIFILTLGLLVISHELGHFMAARHFGIKVLEFGFGLPPRVIAKMRGDTLISLNALPIGGFVRLLGEDEADADVRDRKDSFAHKPVLQRMAVVAAGVTINLLMAWAIFYGILFYQDFRIFYPLGEPSLIIDRTLPGYPGEQAGLQVGDKVIKVDAQDAMDMQNVITYIRGKANTPVTLQVQTAQGEQKEVQVTPKQDSDGGKIGVAFQTSLIKEYKTPTEKIFSGITYSWDLTVGTLQGLGKLFGNLTRAQFSQASQSVAGPIGLAVLTNDIVSQEGPGVGAFYVWFVGVLSLTLAIMNSLPFPALDGGRFAFLAYELVTRRKPNAQFERWVHTVGMVMLLGAMLLITYSDLTKISLFR